MSSGQEDHIEQTQEQTQQQPKVQQKNDVKKQASYTYWVDEKNKSRTLPPEQQPQKIDPQKVAPQKTQDGRSNWNTVGTWEHRKISLTEVQKQYTQKVNEWLLKNYPQGKIKKLQLKGESQVIFTRNKKTVTYEINGKVEFQKKLQEEKEEKEQPKVENQVEKTSSVASSSEDDKSENISSSDKSPEKQTQSKPKTESKSKAKPQTMTFEIVDLTDHGDRDFKTKADDTKDKAFIAKQGETLLTLLEEVLKSYKEK